MILAETRASHFREKEEQLAKLRAIFGRLPSPPSSLLLDYVAFSESDEEANARFKVET